MKRVEAFVSTEAKSKTRAPRRLGQLGVLIAQASSHPSQSRGAIRAQDNTQGTPVLSLYAEPRVSAAQLLSFSFSFSRFLALAFQKGRAAKICVKQTSIGARGSTGSQVRVTSAKT